MMWPLTLMLWIAIWLLTCGVVAVALGRFIAFGMGSPEEPCEGIGPHDGMAYVVPVADTRKAIVLCERCREQRFLKMRAAMS